MRLYAKIIRLKIVSSRKVGPNVRHLVSSLNSSSLFGWEGKYLVETKDKRGRPCEPHLNATIDVRPHRGDIDRAEFYSGHVWELLNEKPIKHRQRYRSVPWYVDVLPSDFDLRSWEEYATKNGDTWTGIGEPDLWRDTGIPKGARLYTTKKGRVARPFRSRLR